MKLLAPVLLLLPALAAAVWSHSHGPDPNAIYRQGDFHDHGDVAGAGRYRYHDHPYGGGAAGRAAAEGGYGSDSDSGPGSGMGSGSGSGNSRHHLLHKYKRHYKPVGCNVRFRPIESLMGVGATQCAECLTATAIAGGNKSDDKKHGSYYASAGAYYAKAKCRDVCDYVPRVGRSSDLDPAGRAVRCTDSSTPHHTHNPGERVLRAAAPPAARHALPEREHLLPGLSVYFRLPVLWYVVAFIDEVWVNAFPTD